jgi:hypothetical protein
MAATTVKVRMQLRRDTAADWVAANPVLLDGELGYETDTGKIKIGNGSTAWNGRSYVDGFGSQYYTNPQSLTLDATIPINTNAVAFGPSYTIATGVTLTVSSDSFFRLI